MELLQSPSGLRESIASFGVETSNAWWAFEDNRQSIAFLIGKLLEHTVKEKKPALHAYLRSILPIVVQEGELYAAKMMYKELGEEPALLIERMKQAGVTGLLHHELISIAKEYGNQEDKDHAIAQGRFIDVNLRGGKMDEVLQELQSLYRAYCQKNGLSGKHVFKGSHANAALYLHENPQYDVAFAIVNGGCPLPNALHSMGDPVGYIEYHRTWNVGPRFKRIANDSFSLRKGMHILLCEDDAVRGQTLRKVMQKIDRLSPERVDLCFTGENYDKSLEVALKHVDCDAVFHSQDLPRKNVYTNILKMNDQFRNVLAESAPA